MGEWGKQWLTILGGFKSTADCNYSHETKRSLLLVRKVMTNLDSILKNRDIILPTNLCLVKATGLSSSHVWMWELDHIEGWKLKYLCCWAVVLEKTFESPLDWKEIKPVDPKGNQSWIIIRRTNAEVEAPIVLPPDAKSQLIRKDPDAGKDWRQEDKRRKKDEMVGLHHWHNGYEFE